MKTINEIRQILSLPKQSLYKIYQITEIGIFSSYARESRQKQVIYIDILVDYEIASTFIMLVELRDYLSQLFGLKVDIITKSGLKPQIRDRVLAKTIYI
ncbi:nucleotidyltransferase family protein [Nostoc sp. DSM 114167]|jgi:predicted nucleotidyltransferase|uniref:nucleotidyltransferase family protein n=1 Tax=Nostoc sp. DSM 114167 TaxID=3439050 RepID=UPI0040453969